MNNKRIAFWRKILEMAFKGKLLEMVLNHFSPPLPPITSTHKPIGYIWRIDDNNFKKMPLKSVSVF